MYEKSRCGPLQDQSGLAWQGTVSSIRVAAQPQPGQVQQRVIPGQAACRRASTTGSALTLPGHPSPLLLTPGMTAQWTPEASDIKVVSAALSEVTKSE